MCDSFMGKNINIMTGLYTSHPVTSQDLDCQCHVGCGLFVCNGLG